MIILITLILILFLLDFKTIRKQNDTIIELNEKVIYLLEEIKNK